MSGVIQHQTLNNNDYDSTTEDTVGCN